MKGGGIRMKPFLLPTLLILLAVSTVNGQVIDNKKSLKGLTGVGVWYRAEPDDLKEINLSLNQLSTDATVRLRKAGIRVLETKQEQQAAKGYAHLTVGVSLLKSGGLWVYYVDVTLSEWVYLARASNESLYLTTWNNTGVLGMANQDEIQDSIRQAIGDALDKFISDYLAMNPK
jgi:hypothetical protein